MKYEEETYVLDTLKEIQETIRSLEFKQLIKETHENNIMLRQIIKIINAWFAHHNQENDNDLIKYLKGRSNLSSDVLSLYLRTKQNHTFRVQYIN